MERASARRIPCPACRRCPCEKQPHALGSRFALSGSIATRPASHAEVDDHGQHLGGSPPRLSRNADDGERQTMLKSRHRHVRAW